MHCTYRVAVLLVRTPFFAAGKLRAPAAQPADPPMLRCLLPQVEGGEAVHPVSIHQYLASQAPAEPPACPEPAGSEAGGNEQQEQQEQREPQAQEQQ